MDKKCILFSRVSTSAQDLDQQNAELEAVAFRLGFSRANIINIYNKESAVTLSIDERVGLAELKKIINEVPVDTVIIYEISRISRRPADLYKVRDWLLDKSIQLVCIKPYFELIDKTSGKINESANLVLGLYAAMIENEGYIRKERTMRGKAKAKADGKFIGGKLAFGFGLDDENRIIVDENKAVYVKMIYGMYRDGKNLFYISEKLKEYGLSISSSTLLKMLHNNNYRDKIIDADVYDEVQDKIAGNRTCPDNRDRTWRFAERLIICPYCGSKLKKNGDSFSCANMIKKNGLCTGKNFTIKTNKLDSVLLLVGVEIFNAIAVGEWISGDEKLRSELDEMPVKKEIAEKQLNNIQIRMDRLAESFVAGLISKDKMQKMKDKIMGEKIEVENRIKNMEIESERIQSILNEEQEASQNCIDWGEMKMWGRKKIWTFLHKWIDKIEVEIHGNLKMLIIYVYSADVNRVIKYRMGGVGRSFRVEKIDEEIFGGVQDLTEHEVMKIDWLKVSL